MVADSNLVHYYEVSASEFRKHLHMYLDYMTSHKHISVLKLLKQLAI